jgi:hypothetical protein
VALPRWLWSSTARGGLSISVHMHRDYNVGPSALSVVSPSRVRVRRAMQRLTQSTSRIPLGGLLRSALKSVVVVVASLCRPSILVCVPPACIDMDQKQGQERMRVGNSHHRPIHDFCDRSPGRIRGSVSGVVRFWCKKRTGRSEAVQRCTAPAGGETRGDKTAKHFRKDDATGGT